MTRKQKVLEMAQSLFNRYDSISKKDAATFLKGIYPKMTLRDFMDAYKMAYE